ncbi:MAG: ATP-binding cassette domain-containing protein [Acidobacteria bacterium]|nr:ATP-binding cassette domain-containing protein [Acidobacteriota bacterium]
MNGSTPAIEFRDVSVSFDGVPALRQVSFVLPPGGMICITGDSQSGKSVLLNLAIGFLQPDEGQVMVNGNDISRWEESELLTLRRERMGMVFQEAALFTGQSVFDNAAYRLNDQNWPEEETRRAVLEVLTFVGLQDELDKMAEELSGGMKRRLEIARALVGWPSIMLFDEPTAGLDPINAHQVLDLIIRARDLHGISSLLVTKALHEIPYLAGHQAQQEAEGSSVVAAKSDTFAVQVLVLEAGSTAFFGASQDFEQSDLPAIQHLLHPVTDALHTHLEVDDPWKQNRLSKKKLL